MKWKWKSKQAKPSSTQPEARKAVINRIKAKDWAVSAEVSKHYREDSFYLVGAIKVTTFKQAVAVSLSQVPCQI